ncbi:RNA-binding post-transcriptional regulator cip2 [Neolecta irregularis DAH-3]|uniref:RNA-binding post-transcriptional regulator cip2 n=1 Tax=Neolecta irregularis (strain DAH-3) TaxID=1198029 RepID=A0A1U7LH45_NEOID|nr:RNA-binding post-transcriptional regulator cip2 [Neolecta irregularis DAH-3]|eukprot:OLL21969.1 RNA-binding post-transcriptional regulator cip2 [Neolecta irregularis DAH-3]
MDSFHYDNPAASHFESIFSSPASQNVHLSPSPNRFDSQPRSATGVLRNSRSRAKLPTHWLSDDPSPTRDAFSNEANSTEEDQEVIPTAVVIKNIPFAIKKEQLLEIMEDIGLPKPYAFNYHFDNGMFRGLAFANFHTPDDTDMIVTVLNGYDIQGRKLRVEYKKVLPAADRERIEREKAEKRRLMEEMGLVTGQMQSSLSLNPGPIKAPKPKLDIDMNDPDTLELYSQVLLFRDDKSRVELEFTPTLTPTQRRIVHVIASKLGLEHGSRGEGDQRRVCVMRPAVIQPSLKARPSFATLGRSSNRALLDPTGTSASFSSRMKPMKSFADLRSAAPQRRPSPISFDIRVDSPNGLMGPMNLSMPFRQPRGPEVGKDFLYRKTPGTSQTPAELEVQSVPIEVE